VKTVLAEEATTIQDDVMTTIRATNDETPVEEAVKTVLAEEATTIRDDVMTTIRTDVMTTIRADVMEEITTPKPNVETIQTETIQTLQKKGKIIFTSLLKKFKLLSRSTKKRI
jgi:hypothetical protein